MKRIFHTSVSTTWILSSISLLFDRPPYLHWHWSQNFPRFAIYRWNCGCSSWWSHMLSLGEIFNQFFTLPKAPNTYILWKRGLSERRLFYGLRNLENEFSLHKKWSKKMAVTFTTKDFTVFALGKLIENRKEHVCNT